VSCIHLGYTSAFCNYASHGLFLDKSKENEASATYRRKNEGEKKSKELKQEKICRCQGKAWGRKPFLCLLAPGITLRTADFYV